MCELSQDVLGTGRAKMQACIADGSCPEVAGFTPSKTAADCVNGNAEGYPCRNINLSSFTDFVGLGTVS